MNIHPSRPAKAIRVEAGERSEHVETLAEETPVALVYNGLSHAVMMVTPADLDDFAYGFSLTEGIVESASEIAIVDRLETAHGISLEMRIPQARFDLLDERSRNLTGRTGCGLCGAATLAAAIRSVRRVPSAARLDPASLFDAFADLEARQPLNSETGAVHAAAVIDAEGRLHVREDVGRHNALDKAVGGALRAGLEPQALLVTSRASYEIVHKAAQVGIGLVAAISAPTALAVRVAQEAGVVLIGFARGRRLTVYAGDF
jgi:formate dehydrogenase accessory protein FdhD